MKKRSIIALILALSMIMSATSCGFVVINDLSGDKAPNGKEPDTQSDGNESESADKYIKHDGDAKRAESEDFLNELDGHYYDGAVFFITTPSTDYISPEDTGDAVSKLAYERNRDVEERFGVKIVTSVRETSTLLEELKQAEKSESYYTDLLMIPVYMVGEYKVEDVLLNMRTIPFFDIDKPYFNKASSDMASGGYSTFGVAGHASISPSSLSAVFMNKTLLTEAGVDISALYRDASDGNWTFDMLLAYSEAVRSLNGTKLAADPDFAGYRTVTAQNTVGRLADLIFKASGNNFIITGRRRVPSVGYTVTSSKSTMEALASIFGDEYAVTEDNTTAVSLFAEGGSAFLIDYLCVMPEISESGTDFGVLPLPMGEESDEYRTLVSNNELVFAIPKSHTNPEYAGVILSALNAASYGYIYDEYVNYCMVNYLTDNESVGMLECVIDSATFDFALAFGNAYPEIADATYKLIRECVATGELEEYYIDRLKKAIKVMRENFDLVY